MTGTDWVGAIGVTILLVAFFLNCQGRLSSDQPLYHALNALGAAMACTASILIAYLPFVLLEGAWTVVSLVGLVKHLRSGSALLLAGHDHGLGHAAAVVHASRR
ncbi:MAG: hypothetical protein KTR31_16540 [Myxococcales bacterium]|nr:hypothetical protein [Myxococcales bacterium]